MAKGAYILAEASSGKPDAIIIATGSEVQIAVAARETLEAQGMPTRVVSMPCQEWFMEQEPAYRQLVLPPDVKVRASIEAAVTMGWRDFVGDHGEMLGLNHYGASAPSASSTSSSASPPTASWRPCMPACRSSVAPRAPRPETDRTAENTEQAQSDKREDLMTDALAQLSAAGVSIWIDDLSRTRLVTGNLADLVRDRNVVGVTTNPTIFAKAIDGSDAYDAQIHDSDPWRRVGEALRGLTAFDVRWGCDVLRPVYDASAASTAGCPTRSTRASRTTPTRPRPKPARCGGPSTDPTCT